MQKSKVVTTANNIYYYVCTSMAYRTLLVSFQSNTDTLGLKYIHAFLLEQNVDSKILFIPKFDRNSFQSIKDFFVHYEPKIIGISLMSPEYYKAKEFSQFVKKEFPDINIVWGGIHPTIDPLRSIQYADYVFRGESEHTYCEFVTALSKGKPVENISNLVYKSPNGVKMNKLRPLNQNLDALPFPEHLPNRSLIMHSNTLHELDRALFKKYTRYSGKFYSIITTRGCPFACSYCCNSAFSKLYGPSKVRKRSVENVIKEMKHAIRLFPDLLYFNIQDDNFFSYDLEWMKSFAMESKREIKKNFVCRTTPAHLNEEKIITLKQAGLSWIFMGLQSGSEKINMEVYKRYVPNEKFLEATKIVLRNKIAGFYDVILDNPYETEEDVLETIKILLEIPKPFMLQLFSLCFYQGTELYERATRENKQIENPLKKNYSKYQPTYLNKVIRLCPLLPKFFIRYLVQKRNTAWTRMLVSIIYMPSILVIEPLVYFRLILISYDNNLFKTMNMILIFQRTAFSRIILRK